MSKRKFKYEKPTQEDLAALAEQYPKAVVTVTHRRPVYRIIAMLLEAGVPVPGIKLVEPKTEMLDLPQPARAR